MNNNEMLIDGWMEFNVTFSIQNKIYYLRSGHRGGFTAESSICLDGRDSPILAEAE